MLKKKQIDAGKPDPYSNLFGPTSSELKNKFQAATEEAARSKDKIKGFQTSKLNVEKRHVEAKKKAVRLPVIEMLATMRDNRSLDISATLPQKMVEIKADQRIVSFSIKASLLSKNYVLNDVIEQAIPVKCLKDLQDELYDKDTVETQIVYRHHHHHYHHHWFPKDTPLPRQEKIQIPCKHPREFVATTVDSYFEDITEEEDRDEKLIKKKKRIQEEKEHLEPDIPIKHEHVHYHSHINKTTHRPPHHISMSARGSPPEGQFIPKVPKESRPHTSRVRARNNYNIWDDSC